MKKEYRVISSNGDITHLSSLSTNPIVHVVVDILAVEIAQRLGTRVHLRGSKNLIGNIVSEKSVH